MKTKAEIKKERAENPRKRERYLLSMRETSEMISTSLGRHPVEHTCHEKEFCEACSLGQQAADLAAEGIGIEGIDF
jgi:hypothetical protein